MKYLELKEKVNRKKYKQSEISQLLYKQLYKNSSFNIKRKISLKFSSKKRNVFNTRFVNRCVVTGRGRGIISRDIKMSRYCFRLYCSSNKIPGIFKY